MTTALDPNMAMVIMGVIGIIVPMATLLVNFLQNRSIAKDQSASTSAVAIKVEEARQDSVATRAAAAIEVAAVAIKVEETRVNLAANNAHVGQQLDVIHTLVNGRLTQALATIEELKRILQGLAPNDQRVQELVSAPP